LKWGSGVKCKEKEDLCLSSSCSFFLLLLLLLLQLWLMAEKAIKAKLACTVCTHEYHFPLAPAARSSNKLEQQMFFCMRVGLASFFFSSKKKWNDENLKNGLLRWDERSSLGMQ
jgi:hypothetical protein